MTPIGLLESILLGIVQGLTEFLPVSSSGHLVLFRTVLGVRDPMVSFVVALHFGTLCAVFVVFRRDFLRPLRDLAGRRKSLSGAAVPPGDGTDPVRLWWLVLAGSVPTAAIGLAIQDRAEALFGSADAVGLMLVATGALLLLPRLAGAGRRGTHPVRLIDGLVIGLVQGIAVIPGISRSGSTIATGQLLGLRGGEAARFSFLLSVPAILGANVLEAGEAVGAAGPGGAPGAVVLLAGLAAAFLSGWVALKIVLRLMDSGRLDLFSYYCFGIGFLVIGRFWL